MKDHSMAARIDVDASDSILAPSAPAISRENRVAPEYTMRTDEDAFRVLFASHPDPMWVYDLRTLAFLEVNDAAVAQYGYTRDEFLALSIADIRPPEDEGRLMDDLRQRRPALQHSGIWRHRRKDGQVFDVEITSHTITFAERAAALVIARDVTERRRVEEALREANRRMEEFLSIAGHELRTPLTSVLGNVQLAAQWLDEMRRADGADRGLSPTGRLDQVAMLLRRMERQGRVLSRLVNDVLDTSRIQAGRLALRPELCDLAALVREVVREHQQQASRRVLYLEVGDDVSTPVTADVERITQVLTNFLSNALKYAPPDQPITVGLHVAGAMARVWVRDAGPGLSAEERDQVWERFYRARNISHQDGSSVGLGLGLFISRTIVERHGGQTGVESVPGRGATFWFSLPVQSGDVPDAGGDRRAAGDESRT